MVYIVFDCECINGYGLLFIWKGKDFNLWFVFLIGYYDVVFVVEGIEVLWIYLFFDGVVIEMYVWGCGMLDDKILVIVILEVVDYFF